MIRYFLNWFRRRRALHERYAEFRNAYKGRTIC